MTVDEMFQSLRIMELEKRVEKLEQRRTIEIIQGPTYVFPWHPFYPQPQRYDITCQVDTNICNC